MFVINVLVMIKTKDRGMPRKSIVICEKDVELRKSLALALEQEFDIHEVSDIFEATEYVDSENSDALILDLDMKSSDNLKSIKDFKENHPDTSIVTLYVYSGYSKQEHSIIRDFSDAVLFKPVDITHILDIVNRFNLQDEHAHSANSNF